jgi:hypothetical protein
MAGAHDARDRNGEDPFPEVPRRPSLRIADLDPDDPLRTTIANLADNQGQFVQRLAEYGADLRAHSLSTAEAFLRLETRLAGPAAPLRTRGPAPSSADMIERVGERLLENFKAKAAETEGPLVAGSPEEMTRIAEQVVAPAIAQREQAKELERLRTEETERKRRIDERRSDRRTFLVLTISGLIVAVAGIVMTYMVTKATEHDRGFAEGVKAAPPATLIVPAAAPPAPASAAVSATARPR